MHFKLTCNFQTSTSPTWTAGGLLFSAARRSYPSPPSSAGGTAAAWSRTWRPVDSSDPRSEFKGWGTWLEPRDIR